MLLLAVVFALGGCGSQRGGSQGGELHAPDRRVSATVAPLDQAALRTGDALFAGRLLSLLARTEPTVAFSPLSISDALAMTFAGARGETAAQIARALEFHLPQARLHAAFNARDQALATVGGVTLNVANALYGQRQTLFRQAFLSLLARDYGAGMRIVDFASSAERARAAINAWVSDRTHGKIPSLLGRSDVDPLTRLVLVNAVYLNARWQSPFEKRATSPAPFYGPAATTQVPTMHQTATFGYLRGTNYQALELPYRGRRLALDILLPDHGRLPPLLRRLAHGGALDALRGLQPQRVQLALPRLSLDTHFELRQALSALGMPSAFEPGRADLSGIAGRPGELFIKAVVHEAYVRVDEAGTEGAAATAVTVDAVSAESGGPAIVFTVDRPFAFVLRDTQTGAILFLGAVARP